MSFKNLRFQNTPLQTYRFNSFYVPYETKIPLLVKQEIQKQVHADTFIQNALLEEEELFRTRLSCVAEETLQKVVSDADFEDDIRKDIAESMTPDLSFNYIASLCSLGMSATALWLIWRKNV